MKCTRCGEEMSNTSSGCHICGNRIGANTSNNTINNCFYEPNDSTFRPSDWSKIPFTFNNQGWICPKRGAVLSPFTSFCPFCTPKQSKIIYRTSADEFIGVDKYNEIISEAKKNIKEKKDG